MTIALGFCGNEGVILAADSQETVSGYIKNYDGKVRTSIYEHFVMAIAGSGPKDYIKMAMDKACEGLDGKSNFREIEKIVETNLLTFFDKHLAPWAYFPERERPDIELLIGLSVKDGAHALFHYSGTSFYRVLSGKAIGAGILLADSLMHPYGFGLKTLEELSSATIFILHKVKKQVDGCGGFTNLTALKKGGRVAMADSAEIEKMEKEFEELEKQSTEDLKHKIIARHLPEFWWVGVVLPANLDSQGLVLSYTCES